MKLPWGLRTQTEFMAMRNDRDYWRELYDAEVRIRKELATKFEQRNNQLLSLSHKLNAAVDREIRIREVLASEPVAAPDVIVDAPDGD